MESLELRELNDLRRRLRELEQSLVTDENLSPGGVLAHEVLDSVLRQAGVYVVVVDRELRFRFISHTNKDYSDNSLIGKCILDYCQPHCHDAFREKIAQVFATGKPGIAIGEGIANDWFLNHFGPVMVGGKVVAVCNFAQDITDRVRTEAQLRASESRWKALVHSVPDVIVLLSATGEVQEILNPSPEYREQDVVGRPGAEFISPEYREFVSKVREEVMTSRQSREVEFLEISGRWYLARMGPLIIDGEPTGVIAVCRDISERKLRENLLEQRVAERTKELNKANEKLRQERRSLKRLVEIHERDRRLIAYEIHDGLVQDISGALMFVDAATGLVDNDLTRAMELCEQGKKVLRNVVDEARRLINGLRPPALDRFGLVPAITTHLQDLETQCKMKIEFVHDVDFDRLAPAIETAIYRIVIEAANNFCNHSGSPRARVEIVQKKRRVRLTMQDWGCGFDKSQVKERRFGLESIRERARLLGGEALITSEIGKGTLITVDLPLADVLFALDSRPFAQDED